MLNEGFAAAAGLVALGDSNRQVLNEKEELVQGRGRLQVRGGVLQLSQQGGYTLVHSVDAE